MEYLSMGDAILSGKNSKERSVEIHKSGKVEQFKLFVIKQRTTGFRICPAESHSCFVQYLLTTLPSFLLKWHCVFFSSYIRNAYVLNLNLQGLQ